MMEEEAFEDLETGRPEALVARTDNGMTRLAIWPTAFMDFKDVMAKKADGGKAEETTIKVAANIKILKGKLKADAGFNIEADGDYEGGKEAFAKAVKDAAGKKMEGDTKKADDKKADDKKAEKKKGGGKKGGLSGMFAGGVPALIITEGEGDNAKVIEIRVIGLNIKKKKGG